MQANKDEADKCVDFAKRCINNGDREKARRLLLKARKMFPSSEVDSLLEFLNNFQTSDHDEANIRRRKTKERPTSPERKEPAQANYTAEQLEQVRKLKSSKNHYEVLGVSKDAGDSELKKSYRKLALQFHPDKNLAPGATEAFKAIGTAFSVLSNAEKRKQYDMYLANPSRDLSRGGGGREYTNDFEGDITAEELFRMFFCGNHQGATFVRRNNGWRQARTQAHHPEGQVPASSVFFQLLPILVLVFLSLMSSWFVSDPVYSLKPSNKYSILRRTSRLSVTYYVKESFGHDYHGNMYALEQAIEEDYVQLLRNSCAQERIYKDNMLWRARNFGDSAQYKKAQGLTTPSCLRLQEIYT